MFQNNSKMIEIAITMVDGTKWIGNLVMGQSTSIDGLLSKDTQFIEFISESGQRQFLSKLQVSSIEPFDSMQKTNLGSNTRDSYSDVYSVLEVTRNCTREEAKESYHRLVKKYHPDTYNGNDLPKEVQDYMTMRFRQINTAYSDIANRLASAA